MLKLWQEVIDEADKRSSEVFWLLDGPPYPNAEPHLGHLRGLAIKDFLIKYHTMLGKRIFLQPGFDVHGLPIENKVEKELGIKSKKDIEKIGVKKFMDRCRDFAFSNIDLWMNFYRDAGIWFFAKKPYITASLDYMNSVWWALKKLYQKGLIKKGKKPFYWCPHCQTVLSGYEVTDKYKDLEDWSIFVKFPTEKGFYLLAWTTTPWTLPGNVALVIREDATYVEAEVEGHGRVVLAEPRLKVLEELGFNYRVLRRFPGKELIGLKYLPVIECSAQKNLGEKAHRVYASREVIKEKVAAKVLAKKEVAAEATKAGHFVNLEEGTGIVHCAPGHGPEDYEIGRIYGLPAVSPVDAEGKFTEEVEPFAGMRVRAANEAIISYLEARGLLLAKKKVVHRYPICWRCNTPLIFRLTDQWYLDVEAIKEELKKAAKEAAWYPPFALERMLNWIENAEEWILSRQRYWNIPLPFWVCENGHVTPVGSKEELEKLSGVEVKDLHRDTVDDIVFPCPVCGAPAKRVKDVLDVWFDSGAAPFASLGYPHKNKQLFSELFPASRIEEGQDQIRGWFYTLLVLSTALFGRAPFKAVSMHGWVLDEKGEKMSKSKGNFITARKAIEVLGPDLARFYILWESLPWESINFSFTRAKKEVGKFFTTFRNLVKYLRDQLSSSGLEEDNIGENLRVEDKWILGRLHSTIAVYHEAVATYHMNRALRALWSFILSDLSKTYMKIAKERIRKGDSVPLKVLKDVLKAVLYMVAPAAPFFAEEIYQEVKPLFGAKKSIFLERIPGKDAVPAYPQEVRAFERAVSVVDAVLQWRDREKRPLRFPIAALFVEGIDPERAEIIAMLTNTKEVYGFIPQSTSGLLEVAPGIYLDPKITPKLKAEWIARELSRRIQVMRKELGLKQQTPVTVWILGNEQIKKAVELFKNFIKERTNAVEVELSEPKEEVDLSKEWEIKTVGPVKIWIKVFKLQI